MDELIRFRDDFEAMTGNRPFPWQEELFRSFLRDDVPRYCDIPTGLGKTSVMAIWLVARTSGAKAPRRLVYVVDRRAVVDQATTEATKLRAFVDGQPEFRARLGLSGSLPISTLRGQHVDKREWLEDPSMPAIIVGTVDMIGSRLLFEGYRVSRKMRPYHAGLLGADTLVVLDEAHLVPPFERLLDSIADGASYFGPNDEKVRTIVPEFKLLSLSATGRNSGGNCHGLGKDDFEHDVVKKRLNAPKRLVLKPLTKVLNAEGAQQSAENKQSTGDPNAPAEARVGENPATDERKKQARDNLVEALAQEAWKLADNGEKPLRILVFCHERQIAQKVEATLKKLANGDQKAGRAKVEIETELFVGGRRVFEREQATERLKELGFLAGNKVARTKSTFLIATSAAEVGVDLDADHMVCDLVPWERMVQRLGRVNRRGDGNATVIGIVEPEPVPNKKEQDAIAKQKVGTDLDEKELKLVTDFNERVLQWKNCQSPIEHLPARDGGFDASPGALRQLKEKAKDDPVLERVIDAATTPAPLRPPLTRALVDAWSMTSLEAHTGRPAIDPWLRGWIEVDPPQTTVVWRTHLLVRSGSQPTKREIKEIEAFFEAAPPHTSELLETRTRNVIDWLGKRGLDLLKRKTKGEEGLPGKDDVVAFVLARDLTLRRRPITLGELVTSDDKKNEKEKVESVLEGATLVVDARLAGLNTGLLDSDENTPPPTADGDNWLAEGIVGFHVRCVAAGESVVTDSKWHERRRFPAEKTSEGEPLRWLIIEKWRDDAATEDDRSASRPQFLDEHQSWAESRAREIATRLGLNKEYVEMLAAAARLHDEGKRAKCWQRAFKAPASADYAKTEGPINYLLLDGYRHEFGSLPRAERDERVKQLPEDLRELALHIVAAHHGFGRPIIGTSGCEDAPPSLLQQRAREVALRFARLQRRWGPWGLAWWEALLRAADHQASRENDKLPSPTQTEVRHG
jgi:CRISPR-associated endonuclease/helicase Cas3